MTQNTLKPLSDNIHLLGDILGDTLRQLEGPRVFNTVEKLRRLSQKARLGRKDAHREIEHILKNLPHDDKYKIVKAFTEFLRLANLCEQVHRIRRRHDYRMAGKAPQRAAPLDTFQRLLKSGIPAAQIKKALLDIQIELVLTAHPTEAELPQAIRTYRDLSACLLKLDSTELAHFDRNLVLQEIRSLIMQLWLSSAVRDEKPTPVDEARYGLELAERILWHTVPHFHYQMSDAYKQAVGDMSQVFPHPIRFSSWMGGDRDGHPGVTSAVTREVLLETSAAACKRYMAALADLRSLINFSADDKGARLQKLCHQQLDALTRQLETFQKQLGTAVPAFDRAAFLKGLNGLQAFLKKCGLEDLAKAPLQELIWRVRIFGLSFLKLDIRQSADVHDTVVQELLGPQYGTLQEADKIKHLMAALRKPVKLPTRKSPLAKEVLATLKLYQTMPKEFLGPYIISMAAHASDMLGVQFLMRAAGVTRNVPICPLFETPDSLQNATATMATLYALPVYKKHAGQDQHIMIGYSDSAKRGGYLNAAWEIHKLQSGLTQLGKKSGIKTIFFHGRGGSVARGGGPIETALMALPRPHLSRTIRITEQGEAINAKFGLPEVAERTMELYLSGFMESLLCKPEKVEPEWRSTMERLAQNAATAFRDVVYENPDFMPHYMQITPTGELGLLNIGSRPGRRKKDNGLEGLRAIPWVFGWTQSRTLLPAWLGIAEALEADIKAGHLKRLQKMYQGWPFFRSVMDLVEMVVAKADVQITEYYSTLLVAPELQGMTKDYMKRLARTKKTLKAVMQHKEILETMPVLARSIRLRSPYVDVLNILQAHLLKEYRAHKNPPDSLCRTLALTMGGISAGMRNTG